MAVSTAVFAVPATLQGFSLLFIFYHTLHRKNYGNYKYD